MGVEKKTGGKMGGVGEEKQVATTSRIPNYGNIVCVFHVCFSPTKDVNIWTRWTAVLVSAVL